MAFIRIQDYESFLEKDLTFFTLTQDTRVELRITTSDVYWSIF